MTVWQDYSKRFLFSAKYVLIAKEPVSAVEIRFILFDLWGEHMVTLVSTEVKDLSVGRHSLDAEWQSSEHDCSLFYASIGYIARVRTADGRIVEIAPEPVIQEARRIAKKFTPANLEPNATRGVAPESYMKSN